MDLSTFSVVLSGKNKKNGFYFSDKRSIEMSLFKWGEFLKFCWKLVRISLLSQRHRSKRVFLFQLMHPRSAQNSATIVGPKTGLKAVFDQLYERWILADFRLVVGSNCSQTFLFWSLHVIWNTIVNYSYLFLLLSLLNQRHRKIQFFFFFFWYFSFFNRTH